MAQEPLRPVERRMVQLAQDGMVPAEIGRRFHRSPEFVKRVLQMAEVPRNHSSVTGDVLRPVERRVLRWRSQGLGYADIADRFGRTPGFVARVEQLARYKLSPR